MSTLGRTRLRLAADTASFDAPLDVLRRATPQFWRGNDLQFELALFFNGALLDVSNLASLTLEVRPLGANGGPPDPSFTPLMGATITSFDGTTTLDDWNAGTKQHALVTFSAAQSNIAAGTAWLSVFAITNDSPGRVITLCAGAVRVLEDGAGLATTPTPAADTFYTAAQSDARFAQIGAGGEGGAPAGDSNPQMDGTAAPGTASAYARADHVHPSDTSRAPLASPSLTGTPTAPTVVTATDSTTKIATPAFVQAAIAAAGGSGGGTWGSITGTLSSQTDLSSALALKAPLASPTFTGTVTVPTVSGTTDNSTKAASTAFVQAVLASIPTLPAISGGTAGKLLSNDGSTISWASPGFAVDGGGHTIFNGSTALTTQKNSGGLFDAGISFYGSLAAESTDGTLHCFRASNNGDVVLIQNNYSVGQSAIDFMSAASGSGSGIFNNSIYGAVGFDYQSGSFPSNGRIYLSFSNAFELNSDGTYTTHEGMGQFCLQQEWANSTDLRQRMALAFNDDGSASMQDFNRNEQWRMFTKGNSGYYDTNWTQVDGTDHYWGTPQGGTIRFTTHDSQEVVMSARSNNFSGSGAEAFGPNRGLFGTNASDGLSLAAYNSSGALRIFTGGYAAAKERFRINSDGSFVASNVVTADLGATLANGQYQFTVYDNVGTAVFKIRYKDAGGTVKTGTVALS
jgi:hypothetical protein